MTTEEELAAMTPRQFKSFEIRLRRKAHRQGLELHRTRTRDKHATDYGLYYLLDSRNMRLALTHGSILAAEQYLNQQKETS